MSLVTIDNWNLRIKHRVFLAGQCQGKSTFLNSIFDCMCRKIPPVEYQSQPHHIVNAKYINNSLYTNIYDDISDCIPHDRHYDLVIVLVRALTNDIQSLIDSHSTKCKTIVIFNPCIIKPSFSSEHVPDMHIQIGEKTYTQDVSQRISLEFIRKLLAM